MTIHYALVTLTMRVAVETDEDYADNPEELFNELEVTRATVNGHGKVIRTDVLEINEVDEVEG